MQQIFETLKNEWDAGRNAVLVSVVENSGSVPRGKGAQMLVGTSGLLCGTIGGGPAERDALTRASELLQCGENIVHQYVLRQNPSEDIGAVCGGTVTVMFHYAPAGNAAWQTLAQMVLQQIAHCSPGYLILKSVPVLSDVPIESAPCLPLPVSQRAILFGAGHCSAALCPLLTAIGFRVWVFDNRPEWNNAQRFPQAENLILGDFTQIDRFITLSSRDYAVIMTSGHSYDYQVERQILGHGLAYVGAIGSHAKTALIHQKLRADGFLEEELAQIHSPIGIAINAVTPEEIAVSIAAEMIAVRSQHNEDSSRLFHSCPMQD